MDTHPPDWYPAHSRGAAAYGLRQAERVAASGAGHAKTSEGDGSDHSG